MPDWLAAALFGGGIGAIALELVRAGVNRKQMSAATGKTQADALDVNISIAGRVRDVAVADWERVTKELDDLRAEFDKFRKDANAELTTLHAELRDEKAQKAAVKRENDELRQRVDELEAEVARLRNGD